MTNEILRKRMDYLNGRLRDGRGNRNVIVREIVKAFNARQDRRRDSDVRIQGWTVIQGGQS